MSTIAITTERMRLMAAFDSAAPGISGVIHRSERALRGTDGTLTGVAAVNQDFLHALYGTFPYVIGIVLLLTMILLTRAFRSVVLAAKAVVLNLFSLGAALGVVVLVFQQGHGSSLWGVGATGSITAYVPTGDLRVPVRSLHGLRGLHALADARGVRRDRLTNRAIELGLARTGKLVTSGALILMFAFLVLSSTPGFEIKSLAVGIAAGIIFDATVLRALLVPALMRLFGDANWWMPNWALSALRLPPMKTSLRVDTGVQTIPAQSAAPPAERLPHPSEL